MLITTRQHKLHWILSQPIFGAGSAIDTQETWGKGVEHIYDRFRAIWSGFICFTGANEVHDDCPLFEKLKRTLLYSIVLVWCYQTVFFSRS